MSQLLPEKGYSSCCNNIYGERLVVVSDDVITCSDGERLVVIVVVADVTT